MRVAALFARALARALRAVVPMNGQSYLRRTPPVYWQLKYKEMTPSWKIPSPRQPRILLRRYG
jgi:hypothetical protein